MIGLPALPAFVEGNSGRLGPALDDGIDCFSMLFGDGIAKELDVLGSEGAEDLSDCCHSQILSWWN